MPPRKKTATTEAKPPRPAHTSELCSECGQTEVHPDYKAWSCEHGTWNLADDFDNGEPEVAEQSDDEFLDELADSEA